MPMIVADELEADWKRVRVVQAPGDEERYGNQDTDGSRSTRHFFDPMRRCGAAARAMLEAAAAAQWKVPVSEVQAKNHEVVHGATGRRLGYGALAKAAAQQPVPARETLRLKHPSQFRYIGKGQLKLVDARDIATGKAQYGIDTRLPGMLYAVIARPPVYGGTVASYDDSDALKVPGVVRVVEIEASAAPPVFNPLGGVAVIGRNTWAAIQGRNALKIGWDDGPNADYDSVAYKATLEEAARKPGPVVRNDGDFDAGMAAAAKRLSAEYYLPHLAHATMEPPAAAARITAGQVRGLGLLPVTPGRPRPGREAAGHAGRGRDRARHAARRRIRAQVEARLRHRGGGAVAGDGRQAGQGHLDARGRPASRRTSTRSRWSTSRQASTRGASRSPGSTGASPRRSCRPSTPARSRRRTGSSGWA